MTTVEITYRYETRDTPIRPHPLDSEAALLRLDDGNKAFSSLLSRLPNETGIVQRIIPVDAGDLGLLPAGAPKQRPFAAILGCADARVPVELIFNEGPNDLFVVRVAGNGLGADVLGSLNYAVDHLAESLKLIVVLGHSSCGALTTAVDVFLNPANYLPLVTKHDLRAILDGLLVVVQASAKKLTEAFGPDVTDRPGYREALIEASIAINAALTAYSIQQQLGARNPAELRAAYGVYLLDTREVWAPSAGSPKRSGLAVAPRNSAEFFELGNAIVQSERVISLVQIKQ
jgi:carbonic anhydrase